MEKILYAVRKHGAVKTENKDRALEIVRLGKKYGFTFQARKQGWNWLIEDMDQ